MHFARFRYGGPLAGLSLAAVLSLGGCGWFGGSTPTDPATAPDPEPSTRPAERPVDTPDSTLEDPPPQLRVRISEEERARLLESTMQDLDTARNTAAVHPDPDALSPELRQRWETLDHYIELTESFLAENDLRAAADVALKARLLAEELHRD